MAFDFSRSHVAKDGFREPYLSGNRKRFDSSLEDIQKMRGQLSHVLPTSGYGFLNLLFGKTNDDGFSEYGLFLWLGN